MTSVGSYQAKTHLPELIERVAQGEKILITRRGVPVALLTQPPQRAATDVRAVIDQMRRLRHANRLGSKTTIRDLIQEGRRF